eukprot:7571-Eustigmatos_ZCMA.PRE.1
MSLSSTGVAWKSVQLAPCCSKLVQYVTLARCCPTSRRRLRSASIGTSRRIRIGVACVSLCH